MQQTYNSEEEYFAAIQQQREKPTVKCKSVSPIVVGQRATVFVVEGHPAAYLNGGVVHTSSVQNYDEAKGEFETHNTIYVIEN